MYEYFACMYIIAVIMKMTPIDSYILNTWPSVVVSLWKGLADVALVEEVCHLCTALRF